MEISDQLTPLCAEMKPVRLPILRGYRLVAICPVDHLQLGPFTRTPSVFATIVPRAMAHPRPQPHHRRFFRWFR
jgi:hypothetical protein